MTPQKTTAFRASIPAGYKAVSAQNNRFLCHYPSTKRGDASKNVPFFVPLSQQDIKQSLHKTTTLCAYILAQKVVMSR